MQNRQPRGTAAKVSNIPTRPERKRADGIRDMVATDLPLSAVHFVQSEMCIGKRQRTRCSQLSYDILCLTRRAGSIRDVIAVVKLF